MFTRFSRSWELIKASGAVLRQDKELLLFPFFSAIATLLVAASFIVPLIVTGAFERSVAPGDETAYMVFLFLFYLVQYFIIFFFNSALVGAAMIRLDGGDPTVRDGLRIASSTNRADPRLRGDRRDRGSDPAHHRGARRLHRPLDRGTVRPRLHGRDVPDGADPGDAATSGRWKQSRKAPRC